MEKCDYAELNRLWEQGEQADSSILSEMRTGVLLYDGTHYKATADKLMRATRNSSLSENQRLRLVKNHVQVVCNRKIEALVSLAPDVAVFPYNDADLHQSKNAEIGNIVADDMKDKQDWRGKIERWLFDYVVTGECASFVYWHPNKGKFLGYEQKVNEDGEPLFDHPDAGEVPAPKDPLGQEIAHNMPPTADEGKPKFQGQLMVEIIFPGDLRRPSSAEGMQDAPWLGYQKMVPIDEAKALVDDEELQKKLLETSETTFKAFDASKSDYVDTKGMCRLRHMFFRQSVDFPEGQFFLLCDGEIIAQDKLPFGVFPMEHETYDSISKCPRGKGPIKDMRPSQANINMLASKAAEHVLTIGDDKVITQQGTKLQKGESWSGIREWKVNGPSPTFLPGRTGDQFAGPLQAEVAELYKLGGEDYENDDRVQADPWAMLFMDSKQRIKHSRRAQKFERFLGRTLKLYIQLAKRYLPDDYLFKAAGKNQQIDMPEFREMDDDGFNFKVKPVSDDLNSTYGKILIFQHLLQYVGKDIPPEVLGMLLKDMPFINGAKAASLMTVDIDNIESDILAMDRGEQRPARDGDKHDMFIKALQARMRKKDFALLPPQVSQLYQACVQQHQTFIAQQQADILRQEQGFIPMDGPLSKCDLYSEDGKRMTLPEAALQWLADALAKQGAGQEQLQQLEQGTQAKILGQAHQLLLQHGGGMQPGQPGQPPQPQQQNQQGMSQPAGTLAAHGMPLSAH